MTRIKRQQQTVEQMIRIYCRRKEGNAELCPRCRALLEYARKRLEACPFGERKSSCRKCSIHCYSPDMRGHIRDVMRYSGPRMLLYHPLSALRHLLSELPLRGKS